MKLYSIEGQISKRVVLLIALLLLSSVFIVNTLITSWLENEYDGMLESKASVLVTLVKDMPEGVEFDFADEFMPEFESLENPEYFQLWLDGPEVFERSHSLKNNELPYLNLQQTGMMFQDLVLEDGRHGRMIQITFIPQIPADKDRTPEKLASQKQMTMAVARERENLDKMIYSVHVFSFVSTLIILVIINYLVKYSVRNSLKPLFFMKEQIKCLGSGNLDLRLNVKNSPDELKELIAQFNELLTRLEQSFLRERQFSSDVAHELRTPIAELRSMSEIGLKWPEDTNLVKEFYSGIKDASHQLQSIVNNLLALARCEQGNINLEPKDILLNKFIDEFWPQYKNLAQHKNLQLINNIPATMKIITSPVEFGLIISNLISNAISYSPDNSEVVFDIKDNEDSVALVISNIAEQLDQSDLDVMFDRLWRKSKSRSSSQHAGLGLSLVKAYAELIGLKITTNLSDKKLISINIDGIHAI